MNKDMTMLFAQLRLPDRRIVWMTGLAALGCALLLRLAFSWISLHNLPATADEALVVMVAKQVVAGEWPLLLSGTPYQVPVESYLMAPLVEWMPRNALGARYLTLVFGMLSWILFMATAVAVFPEKSRWPALVLLLFPSAYWLTYQSGYAPPGYPTTVLMLAIVAWLLARAGQSRHRLWISGAIGLACGIAFSAHLLTVDYILPAFLVTALSRRPRDSLFGAGAFAAGFGVGVIPFLLSLLRHPHAHEAVTGTVTLGHALRHLWNPELTRTLPMAMGMDPPLFPDFRHRLDLPPLLRAVFVYPYLVLVIGVTVERGLRFVQRMLRDRWPSLEPVDFFILATLATLAFDTISERATDDSYRYLLVAVVCLPFIVGHAYDILRRHLRRVVGTAAIALTVFNIGVSVQLLRVWKTPEFPGEVADTPFIGYLIDALRDQGVDRCYASFWLAHRIFYESDGSIVCVPPYNERFLGWPVPYKDMVDKSATARYVLSDGYGTRFSNSVFRSQLEQYGVGYDTGAIGPFTVFGNFRHDRSQRDRPVPVSGITLHGSDDDAGIARLLDGDHTSAWSSATPQRSGMWLEADLDHPRQIQRVTVIYPFEYPQKPQDYALSVDILGHSGGKWVLLKRDYKHQLDRFRFLGTHPVYGGMHQTIWLDAVSVDGLRIAVHDARPGHRWTLGELEIGELESGRSRAIR